MAIVAMNGHKKMSKALDQLNKAVQEKKNEIEQSVEYFKKNAQRTLDDAKASIVESAETADKEVHAKPWAYLGGAAACAMLVGFIVGRLTKK